MMLSRSRSTHDRWLYDLLLCLFWVRGWGGCGVGTSSGISFGYQYSFSLRDRHSCSLSLSRHWVSSPLNIPCGTVLRSLLLCPFFSFLFAELVVCVAVRWATAAVTNNCGRSAATDDHAPTPGYGTGAHSGRQCPCGAGCWSKWLLRRNPDGWTGLGPDDVLAFGVDILDGVTLHDGWKRKE